MGRSDSIDISAQIDQVLAEQQATTEVSAHIDKVLTEEKSTKPTAIADVIIESQVVEPETPVTVIIDNDVNMIAVNIEKEQDTISVASSRQTVVAVRSSSATKVVDFTSENSTIEVPSEPITQTVPAEIIETKIEAEIVEETKPKIIRTSSSEPTPQTTPIIRR